MTDADPGGSRLARAWAQVAAALGIEIAAPQTVTLPSGQRVDAVVLVKHFGAAKGMLVVTSYDQIRRHTTELVEAGYGFSVMSEPAPERPLFIDGYRDVLRDWGWSGPVGQEPDWLGTAPDRTSTP